MEIALDKNGNKMVVLPDIIFYNKQNIDWNEVEKYLERFVGELVEIAETGDIIYLGKDFPDEYAGSKYTRKTRKLMQHRVFVKWWRLPQIKDSGKTRKKNIPVMQRLVLL